MRCSWPSGKMATTNSLGSPRTSIFDHSFEVCFGFSRGCGRCEFSGPNSDCPVRAERQHICEYCYGSHNNKGSHQPAAGMASVARWVNAIELEVDSSTGNTLDGDNVKVIRLIEGTHRIYGARSLSNAPTNFRYLMAQDTINTIVHAANSSLEALVFSVIDGRGNIFSSIQARLIAILEPLRESGALYESYNDVGKRLDMGYTVKCDKALNPASQLADGLVKAKVGVRVSSIGDKITVDIIKSNLTTSVV